MATFSRHGPSAHPLAQDREGAQWLTVDTPDIFPQQGTARAGEEAEALVVPIARLYWFLDGVAGGFGLELGLGAPGAGEDQGRRAVAAQGGVHGENLYCSPRMHLFHRDWVQGGPSR